MPFHTVIVLADISIPSDVDWRNKNIFKKHEEITLKRRCFRTLHFLPFSSSYKDKKAQVTKTCYLPATHPTALHQRPLSTLFFCFLFNN